MNYAPEKGFFGNLKLLFFGWNNLNAKVFNETTERTVADTENREAVEQAITELYLDGVQAQQDITDIQLQILEG